MKTAILLNREYASLRQVGKRMLSAGNAILSGRLPDRGLVLPEYDSFARLVSENPIYIGLDGAIDYGELRECDLLIWEWGWTAAPARRILEIREKLDITTLVFPGAFDRFWREVAPEDLPLHMHVRDVVDLVGVMLADMVPLYQSMLPQALAFHLPVPLEVQYFANAALADSARDHDLTLLTAPTIVLGTATQLPITTLLAFKEVSSRRPNLRGIAFSHSTEERDLASSFLAHLGLDGSVSVRDYVRPLDRFITQISRAGSGMLLSNSQVQGRTALLCACLGIPLVVSENIETHRTLFPETCVRWYDTAAASSLLERLLQDQDFRRSVSEHALNAVQRYDRCRIESDLRAAVAKAKAKAKSSRFS